MNIFEAMLGSITGLFEETRSRIAGFFGYDEATEEIAQGVTDENLEDAELDNLQETVTNFTETLYSPYDEAIADEAIAEEEQEPEPETTPARNLYDEHPIDYETGFYVETPQATEEPLPRFEPEAEEYTTPYDPDDQTEKEPDFIPISPETWGEWEKDAEPDDYNPEEATLDEYTKRVDIAQSYSLPEYEFLELSDEKINIVLELVSNVGNAAELDNVEGYIEEYHQDEQARLMLTTSNINTVFEYVGNMWQFYAVDILFDSENGEYYYAVFNVRT